MDSIHEVANRLTELLGEQKFVEAYEQLYAPEAESTDSVNHGQSAVKGLSNLVERAKTMLSWTEIHHISVSQPLVEGNSFTVNRSINYTIMGEFQTEVKQRCVYQVKGGKIISQQYFTNSPELL